MLQEINYGVRTNIAAATRYQNFFHNAEINMLTLVGSKVVFLPGKMGDSN
jgi:hypothetical protein